MGRTGGGVVPRPRLEPSAAELSFPPPPGARSASPHPTHARSPPRGSAHAVLFKEQGERATPALWGGEGGAGGEGSASHRNAEGGGGSSSSLPAPPQSAKRPTLSDQAPSRQETSRTRKRQSVWNTAQRTSPTASRQPCGVLGGDGTGGGSLRKLRKCLPAVLCAWHRYEIIANIASHGKTNTSKKYVKHQNTLKSMSDCLPS